MKLLKDYKTPCDIGEDEDYNLEDLDTETWVDYPGFYIKEFYTT